MVTEEQSLMSSSSPLMESQRNNSAGPKVITALTVQGGHTMPWKPCSIRAVELLIFKTQFDI